MTNIYARDVSHIKTLDPYRLQELYQMHPCAEHVVKKLLVVGEREGAKDLDTDISDCIRTLTRWQAMRAEDAGGLIESTSLDSPEPTFEAVEKPTLYDWRKIGGAYNFCAMDADGEVHAYTVAPGCDEKRRAWGYWDKASGVGNFKKMADLALCGVDWRESLEARPQ